MVVQDQQLMFILDIFCYIYYGFRFKISTFSGYKIQGIICPEFLYCYFYSMKFDICVGNPPYQGQGGSQSQIYPVFYLWARKNCDQMSMIFPSAWQDPKSGNGLKSMNTPEIKYDKQIVSIDNLSDTFKNISGAKNTNIVYWKNGYDNGLNGEQLIYINGENPVKTRLKIESDEIKKPDEIVKLAEIVTAKDGFKSMTNIISSWNPYNLTTYKKLIDKGTFTNKEGVYDSEGDDLTKVYCVIKKRCEKYIDTNIVSINDDKRFNKYKIIFSQTWGNYGGKYLGGSYSPIIIALPGEICNDAYIECGCCDTFDEVKKLAKYMISRFARGVIINDKYGITSTKDYWKSVPIQDYSEDFWNSDNIDDIDEGLFNKYNVPEDIRKFVRENIQPKTKDDILGYDGKDIDFSKVKEEEIEPEDSSPSGSEPSKTVLDN